jgi:hypothetical protein
MNNRFHLNYSYRLKKWVILDYVSGRYLDNKEITLIRINLVEYPDGWGYNTMSFDSNDDAVQQKRSQYHFDCAEQALEEAKMEVGL